MQHRLMSAAPQASPPPPPLLDGWTVNWSANNGDVDSNGTSPWSFENQNNGDPLWWSEERHSRTTTLFEDAALFNVTFDNSSSVTVNAFDLMPSNSTTGLTPDAAFKYNYFSLFLIPVILCGFFGNVMVCVAVSTEKRLKTTTNYFLLSLAVADALVSIAVMPFSMLQDLYGGNWPFSLAGCIVFHTADVTCCTASIMHMTFISVDRYLGIRNPFQQRNRTWRIVMVKISCVWLLSITVSCPISIIALARPYEMIADGICGMVNMWFVVVGSTVAFFFPLILMVSTYLLTIHILLKQDKLFKRERAMHCQDQSTSSAATQYGAVEPARHRRSTHRPHHRAHSNHFSPTTSSSKDNVTLFAKREEKDHILDGGASVNIKHLVASSPSSAAARQYSTEPRRLIPPLVVQPNDLEQTSDTADRSELRTSTEIQFNNFDDCPVLFADDTGSCAEDDLEREGTTMTFDFTPQQNGLLFDRPNNTASLFTATDRPRYSATGDDHFIATFMMAEANNHAHYQNRSSNLKKHSSLKINRSLSASKKVSVPFRRSTGSITNDTVDINNCEFRRHSFLSARTLANELKATKVLGCVFGIFIISWLPFFVCNVVAAAICYLPECEIPPAVFATFLWTGYFSSAANPIIYAIFNIHFRRSFIRQLGSCLRTVTFKRRSNDDAVDVTPSFTLSNEHPDSLQHHRHDQPNIVNAGERRRSVFHMENTQLPQRINNQHIPSKNKRYSLAPFPSVAVPPLSSPQSNTTNLTPQHYSTSSPLQANGPRLFQHHHSLLDSIRKSVSNNNCRNNLQYSQPGIADRSVAATSSTIQDDLGHAARHEIGGQDLPMLNEMHYCKRHSNASHLNQLDFGSSQHRLCHAPQKMPDTEMIELELPPELIEFHLQLCEQYGSDNGDMLRHLLGNSGVSSETAAVCSSHKHGRQANGLPLLPPSIVTATNAVLKRDFIMEKLCKFLKSSPEPRSTGLTQFLETIGMESKV